MEREATQVSVKDAECSKNELRYNMSSVLGSRLGSVVIKTIF